jgi:hypothetical protein
VERDNYKRKIEWVKREKDYRKISKEDSSRKFQTEIQADSKRTSRIPQKNH